MDGIVLYLIVAIVMGLYFLPSITAWMRGHHSKWAIIALNFLLGWTIIGWIGALIWSLTGTRQ